MKILICLSNSSVQYSYRYSTLVASVPTCLRTEGTDQKETASGNASLPAKTETGNVSTSS